MSLGCSESGEGYEPKENRKGSRDQSGFSHKEEKDTGDWSTNLKETCVPPDSSVVAVNGKADISSATPHRRIFFFW